MRNKSKIFFMAALVTMSLYSCKEDDPIIDSPSEPTYSVPATYEGFTNVSFSGQTQRLGQFLEIKTLLKTANTSGTKLDGARLQAMFANNAPVAQWVGTYEDSKQIKSKTFEPVQAVFTNLLNSIAASSESTSAHTQGTAGVASSADNAKQYLLNENGVEEAQVFEKALMGAHIYYQINEVYTSADKMDVDNVDVTEGKGTAMEHHWDEAFGYFGVPLDFPNNTDNLLFWGAYCNSRNEVINSNKNIIDQFLKGRAAISNNDLPSRDEAITSLRVHLEKVAVASAIHYLNSTIANFDDVAIKGHLLAEAVGFVYSLQFNGDKKMTNDEVNTMITQIGGNASINNLDFYAVKKSDLESARDLLATTFSMEDIKLSL